MKFNFTTNKICTKQPIFPPLTPVHPSLLAHEIVSVQPMSLPSGLLFYQEYTVPKTKSIIKKSKQKIKLENIE